MEKRHPRTLGGLKARILAVGTPAVPCSGGKVAHDTTGLAAIRHQLRVAGLPCAKLAIAKILGYSAPRRVVKVPRLRTHYARRQRLVDPFRSHLAKNTRVCSRGHTGV